MFAVGGASFRQLAYSWAGNVAGDGLVAVALAGTLFFDVPTGDARDRVALYLGLTLAPFAVVAPLLGGVFARFPAAYRAALSVSSLLRAVLAVIMIFGLDSVLLFPLAFGMLVLSRLFGISKNSMLPVAVERPIALVTANAVLARISILTGLIVLPLGALASKASSAIPLLFAAAFFLASAFAGLGLPDPRQRPAGEDAAAREAALALPRTPPRRVRLARTATAGVRLINGYLLLLLAFAVKGGEGSGALDFAALIAAGGVGFGLASFISPWLEKRLREEPMVVAALALAAAAAFIVGRSFSLWSAAGLALAAGLAWGTAKFAFDGLLQRSVHPDSRGTAFTRAETMFQLAWVVGAIIPVVIKTDPELGAGIAGVAALISQTVFVSGLLVGVDRSSDP